MGSNHKLIRIVQTALIATMIFFSSCEKDVFNPEKVKATYQDRFPVKDIDPDMDWKMTSKINVNVSVYEDAGVDYTIRIYNGNPIEDNTSAQLLTEGTASDKVSFTSTIDSPKALTDLYVCRIDPQNRSIVKLVSINNNTLTATFGIPPQSRSVRNSASTRSGNVSTQTPDRSEADSKILAQTAATLQSSTTLFSGDVYKIPAGTAYTGNITTWGISGTVGTVIIEGTWAPSNPAAIQTGIDLIVMGTGKIVLPANSTLSLVGTTRFITYTGASISGKNATITITNYSGGKTNFNAGELSIKELQINGAGVIYNSSPSCDINYLNITNVGGKLINMGHATIGSSYVNSKIENGCYLEVTGTLNGDLTMGDNCTANIANYGSSGNSGRSIIMGNNSLLYIQNEASFSYGTSFTGPTNGNSLVKINKLTSLNGFQYKGGNIYYEVKQVQINNSWEKDTFLKYLKNSDGVLAQWGESPITIPAGDCTGSGNTPNNSGGGSTTNPIPYTYVFEDNFPLVGDYDFNDIVLDVTTDYIRDKKTNAIQDIVLNVTLTAAGATKTLGAGLRIVGISKSAIKSITPGGDATQFETTLTNPRTNRPNFFNYNTSSHMENGDNNIVIPLFNNAHQVFGVSDGTLINTQSGQTNSVNNQKTYTYKLTFKLADQTKTDPVFSKDNLDFFICYSYKSMAKRMEVHLYEFWGYGATAAGTVQQENLDLAGNNTWAVCVPNFRYPKEFINISVSSNPSVGAYPLFLNWAKNRTVNQDWYLYPNADKVCR